MKKNPHFDLRTKLNTAKVEESDEDTSDQPWPWKWDDGDENTSNAACFRTPNEVKEASTAFLRQCFKESNQNAVGVISKPDPLDPIKDVGVFDHKVSVPNSQMAPVDMVEMREEVQVVSDDKHIDKHIDMVQHQAPEAHENLQLDVYKGPEESVRFSRFTTTRVSTESVENIRPKSSTLIFRKTIINDQFKEATPKATPPAVINMPAEAVTGALSADILSEQTNIEQLDKMLAEALKRKRQKEEMLKRLTK